MKKKHKIKWLSEPEVHDYPAAASYLSLLFEAEHCYQIVEKLKKANIENFKSKDIFRASSLSLLGISNSHVESDIKKIKENKLLSPLLLVRDTANGKVIISDGYHRLCAVYTFNEDEIIPCKIV
jgi:disulfide oxidoreductase YuzD